MGLAVRMRNKRTGTTGTFANADVLGSDWEPIDKSAGLPESDSATDKGEEPKTVAKKPTRKTARKSTAKK